MEGLNGQPLKKNSLLQMRHPHKKGGARCRYDLSAVGLISAPTASKEIPPEDDKEENLRQFFSLYNLRKQQEKKKRKGGARCAIDLVAAGLIKDPLLSVKEDNNVAREWRMNPLTMPEILEKVLSNVEDVEDLKSVRCVSKLWMEESLDKWRNTAVFRLDAASEPTLKLTLNIRDEIEPETSQQDLQPWQFEYYKKPQPLHPSPPPTEVLHRFAEKPFKRYKVEVGPLMPPELPCRRNELYFWEKCGPFVNYLHVQLRTIEGALEWILKEACPNVLKEGMIMEWRNIPRRIVLLVAEVDHDDDVGDNMQFVVLEEGENARFLAQRRRRRNDG